MILNSEQMYALSLIQAAAASFSDCADDWENGNLDQLYETLQEGRKALGIGLDILYSPNSQ